MGIETTRALRSRQREAAARVKRLMAQADERSPMGSARRTRLKAAIREGRRGLRALSAAEQGLAEVEARVGAALLRLTENGLSRNEAYKSLGLSRAVGRRLIELAVTTRRISADSSTGTPTDRASSANRADGETGASDGATTKGNR